MAADRRRDAAAATAPGHGASGAPLPDRLSLEQVAERLRSSERALRARLGPTSTEAMDTATAVRLYTEAHYLCLMAEAVERVTKRG